MAKKMIYVAGLTLIVVIVFELSLFFKQTKSASTQQGKTVQDRGFAIAVPTISVAVPTNSPFFPLSSLDKVSQKPVMPVHSPYLFWQEGIFLYMAEPGNYENVQPYAVMGEVKETGKSDVIIIPKIKSDISVAPKQVKAILAENSTVWRYNDRTQKQTTASLREVKKGDLVELTDFALASDGATLLSSKMLVFDTK